MANWLFVVPAIMGVWCVFYLIRNAWVYRVRTDILHADIDAYADLPSYETMMRRFWIWDASKFVGQGEANRLREDNAIYRKAQRGRAALLKAEGVGDEA